MTRGVTTDAATDGTAGGRERLRDTRLRPALSLLVLWMVSVFGFVGLAVAAVADLPLFATDVAALVWLGPGLLGAPVMLYDAYGVRGTPAGGGFRFDAFRTGLALFVVYPFGLPIYLVTRMNGAYVAALSVDPSEMDLGDEFEFGVRDLLHPAADGVPSVWPTVLVLFGWGGVLLGDGSVLVAALDGAGGVLLLALALAVVLWAVAVVPLAFDCYLLARTGYLDGRAAAAVGALTALLYPLAAVWYVPYRLALTYG